MASIGAGSVISRRSQMSGRVPVRVHARRACRWCRSLPGPCFQPAVVEAGLGPVVRRLLKGVSPEDRPGLRGRRSLR